MPLPDSDPSIMAQVFQEPVQVSSDASDVDLTHPRPAWVFDKIKHGTLLSTLCDGRYNEHDPIAMKGGLTKDFPPTFFLHGSADVLVPLEIAQRCCEHLKTIGVNTGIIIKDGGAHGYDGDLKDGDEDFESFVKPGLEFLKKYV